MLLCSALAFDAYPPTTNNQTAKPSNIHNSPTPTTGVFRQRYFGHVTITPKFRTSETIGLKAFMNPDEEEMAHYILNGERVRCVTSGVGGEVWRVFVVRVCLSLDRPTNPPST